METETLTIAQRIAQLQSSLATRAHSPTTGPTLTPPHGNPLPEFLTLNDPTLENMHAAASTFIQDIRTRQAPYWLTLWGRNGRGNGTGKTFLSWLILAAVRGSFGCTPPVKFCHWPSLCDRMQAHDDTAHSFAFAEDAGLLVIDDIGAEHQTAAMLSKLARLSDSRLRKWTILTTNLSLNDWQQRDARISSRMGRDGNRHLCCETKDFGLRQTAKGEGRIFTATNTTP